MIELTNYDFSDLELSRILKLFPNLNMEKYDNINSYYIDDSTNDVTITHTVLNNVFDNEKCVYYTNLFFDTFKNLPISDQPLSYELNGQLKDLITLHDPLPWQKEGLSYTASGYGSKIPTTYKVYKNERLYRVYCRIYSNAGTLYIIENGNELSLH